VGFNLVTQVIFAYFLFSDANLFSEKKLPIEKITMFSGQYTRESENSGISEKVYETSYLGFIHTRYFDAQYYDKKILQ